MADRLWDVSMAWDATLSTGVSSLDDQHKALFECLNMLEGATLEKEHAADFSYHGTVEQLCTTISRKKSF